MAERELTRRGERGHEANRSAATLLDAVLNSYSQIFFSPNRMVGAILLGASFVAPVSGAFGLLAVLVALGTAKAFRFSQETAGLGLLSYNALLVGLGIGALYEPTFTTLGLLMVAAFFSVLATAALNSALGVTFNLPSLTLPFLVVFYLVTALALLVVGVDANAWHYNSTLEGEWLWHPLASYLKSMGAIFFLPRVDAGLFLVIALLVYSRIGFILSLMGFAVAYPVSLYLVAVPDASLHLMMGYNLILVAVALGGVWFVPRFTSFLFALGGVLIGAILTIGGRALLDRMGLSLLILPFNLTVIPMLYAMRQRTRDGSPKAVDFGMGTPEQNLNYFQTRMARFGYLYYVQFSLPVLGRWVCTQGNDGPHTHKGYWRHGFDFEVQDSTGSVYKGSGRRPEDFHCYRLPVIASADGTVAKVLDGITDNAIGEMNMKDNFGNVVILYHGVGLYSMVAHLAPGSIKVKLGEVVKEGDVLGLCGNSGRSPVPHVHFQLQGTARVGAPTIEAAFHEAIVVAEDKEVLHARYIPEEGDVLRNIDTEEDFGRLLRFDIGTEHEYRFKRFSLNRVERIESKIDLYGNLKLTSEHPEGVLYFENKDRTFVIYDYQGPNRSALSVLNLALPRVPLESGRNLVWKDHLVSRYFYRLPGRILRDLVSPFLGLGGVKMEYRMERTMRSLTVHGESLEKMKGGASVLKTVAILSDRNGLESAIVEVKGKTMSLERIDPEIGDNPEESK